MWNCAVAFVALVSGAASEDARSHLTDLGEESLRCSACTLVASQFDDAMDSKLLKAWAGWTTEQRITKLRGTFRKRACPAIGEMQIAQLGDKGDRKFADFNELMKKGGTMSNLNMGEEQKKAVRTLCDLVAKGEMSALVARMESALQSKKGRKKRRLADLRMQEVVCEGLLGTCIKDEEEEEDDDDEEDEREL